MPAKIEMRDLGIGKLRRDAEKLKTQRVTVGYQGPSGQAQHPNANATVAQIAAWQEFGTPGSDDRQYDKTRRHIPSRPFMRTGFAKYQREIQVEVRAALQRVLIGSSDVDAAQADIGERMVEAVRQSILDARAWAKPLAESTIERKGHSEPLIESGTLYNATSYVVKDGDKIVRTGGEK